MDIQRAKELLTVLAEGVDPLTVGICHGQASWQAPQPMHLSVSTTRMPRSSVVIAFCGQALPQAGSSHWRQVSGK